MVCRVYMLPLGVPLGWAVASCRIYPYPKEPGGRLVARLPGSLCLKWRTFLAGEDVPFHRAYWEGGLWQKQETSPEYLYRKQILKLIQQIELAAATGEEWVR